MSTKQNTTRQGRVANPDAAKAAAERAFSGAWGTHDSRPRKQRTRAGADRAAIRDSHSA